MPCALGAAESLVNRVIVVQIRGVCFLAFPPRPAVEVVLLSAAVLRTVEVSTSRVVESLWNRTSRSAAVPYPKHGCLTASDTLPIAATAAAVTTSSSSSKHHSCFWCVYTYRVQSFTWHTNPENVSVYLVSIIGTRMPKMFCLS